MQIAIVGLAGAGKTTVFNTLTRGHIQTGGFGGLELHVGVVKVPDDRLDRLADLFRPRKIVHADVTYVDLPAPPASTDGRIGTEELPAEHFGRLRDADALLHVVRSFDDPSVPHPDGSVDARRDLERLDLEFVLADLAVLDRRLERLQTSGRHGPTAERDANQREEGLLIRLREVLVAGDPLRDAPIDPEEERTIRGYRFLSQKPVLVLLNIGESELGRAAEQAAAMEASYPHRRSMAVALSAKLEMELVELEADEARAFMTELGLESSGLDRVISCSYQLLGLISFLTAGPDEVRAWPVREGSTAVDAAAAIHSDLARGFIRAETVAYGDLIELGSLAEARKAGRLRSEGRTYRVQDGDVIEILFSRSG